MQAIHFVGMYPMWILGGLAFVLLTLGLTAKVFRDRRNFEPGLEPGHAADPER